MATYTDIPPASSGGFGADTSVPVNNSNSVPVTAAELITSLTTNTAGSEVAKFLIKLLSNGAQVNSFALVQAGMVVDPGGAAANWDESFQFGGSEVARIRVQSNGAINIAAFAPTGGINFYNNESAGSLGNLCARVDNFGVQAFNCAIKESQGPNTASANDLVLNGTFSGGGSGNAYVITGSTQMNRLDYGAWQNGARISLRCTGTPLIKHNQTAGGTLVPYFFRSGADFTPTATDTMIDLVLMGATAAGTPVAWYCLNH